MPTWRLYAVLVVAAPIGALGDAMVLLALAVVVLGVAAACVDWLLARDIRHVRTARMLETDRLSLGDWNPVRLELRNDSQRAQTLRVRDVPPVEFKLDVSSTIFATDLRPGATATFMYHVRPPRRGDASFGDLYLRTEGPLGLVTRQHRAVGSAQDVKIYPSLRELRRFDLLVRRGLEGDPVGRPTRRPGTSTEFERVRDYVPDDDFRHINWKATARRGQPLVNQLEAERGQNLVIMLDAGRSMAALAEQPSPEETLDGVSALTKLDYALNAGLLLTYVASTRGDRVAVEAYTDEIRAFVPPMRGRRAIFSTLQTLYNLRAEPVEPDHARAFAYLAQRNLRRSLVVLFTDVADRETSETLAANLLRAARHHLVVCVTLGDPNLRRPALRRPEDSPSLYEKMVAQQLLDERAQLLAQLRAYGVLTVDTDANALNPRLIQTYLDLKRTGRA